MVTRAILESGFSGPVPHWKDEAAFFSHFNITEELLAIIDEDEGSDCTQAVLDMGLSYKAVHGYIALVICVFGTVANILNLIVLKEMSSPINRMLTALAFADMLVMLEYIPFTIHMYLIPTPNFSYHWALFVLLHAHFTQIFHTISIQLTLTMAIWRYVAIRFSNRSSTYCTFKRCNYCILASYICPFLLCMPNYFTFAIYYKQSFMLDVPYGELIKNKPGSHRKPFLAVCEFLKDPNCTKAIRQLDYYVVDFSEMAKAKGGLLQDINFWTFSVFIKLIPCIVLTFFMCWLLNTLYKAKLRHKMLQEHCDVRMETISTTGRGPTSPQQQIILGKENSILVPRGDIFCDNVSSNSNFINGNGNAEVIGGDDGDGVPIAPPSGSTASRRVVGFHPALLNRHSQKQQSCCKRSDRTSKMLVAVLFLFLLTEIPQGIMAFLSGLYGQEFFRYCYNTWAEVWDILALFNSAVNFVLYCFMSRQFRLQFQKLFKLHSPTWMTNCNTTMVSTTV